MRLGAQSSDVEPGTLAHSIYGDVVTGRHRHRYEASKISWTSCARRAQVIPRSPSARHLTEIVGVAPAVHPWYIGVRSHPGSNPRPQNGHPLFNAFIRRPWNTRNNACKPLKDRLPPELCGFDIGLEHRFFLIAGTCSIESLQMSLDVAGQLRRPARWACP